MKKLSWYIPILGIWFVGESLYNGDLDINKPFFYYSTSLLHSISIVLLGILMLGRH